MKIVLWTMFIWYVVPIVVCGIVLVISPVLGWLLNILMPTNFDNTPAPRPKIEDFKDYFKWCEAVEDYEARLAREKEEEQIRKANVMGYVMQSRIEEQEQRDWQAAQEKKMEDSWAAREFQREQREKRNARYRS